MVPRFTVEAGTLFFWCALVWILGMVVWFTVKRYVKRSGVEWPGGRMHFANMVPSIFTAVMVAVTVVAFLVGGYHSKPIDHDRTIPEHSQKLIDKSKTDPPLTEKDLRQEAEEKKKEELKKEHEDRLKEQERYQKERDEYLKRLMGE